MTTASSVPSAPALALRRHCQSRTARVRRALDWLAGRVVLFRLGPFVFVTFGLFAALGALVTVLGSGVILVGQGLAPRAFVALTLASGAGIVAGSWLLAQILDYRLLLSRPREALWRPAFVSWGGIAALPLVFLAASWLTGMRFLVLLDGLARAIALGHALGRLGCLSYGCCFGRPTRHRLSVTYRHPHAKAVRVANLHGIPLHPAALYEAGLDLGIFLLANAAAWLGAPVGLPSAITLLVYAAGRFAIEFWKDNEGRMIAGGLALNHLICLLCMAIGLLLSASALHASLPAPPISWSAGFAGLRPVLPAFGPTLAVVFLGFSLHRKEVGRW